MAFVPTTSPLPTSKRNGQIATTIRPTMTQAPLSRRAALRFAALSIAGVATSTLAASFDLKELKEDVEALKYDEEVLDVGPDSQEKNVTRIKKKEKEPEFRSEEQALIKKEDEEYDKMVASELAEEARLKATYVKPE